MTHATKYKKRQGFQIQQMATWKSHLNNQPDLMQVKCILDKETNYTCSLTSTFLHLQVTIT